MTFDFSKLVVRLKDANIGAIGKKRRYFVPVTRRARVLIKCLFGLGYSHAGLSKRVYGFASKHRPFYAADGTIFFDKFASRFDQEQARRRQQKNSRYLWNIARRCEQDGRRLLAFSQKIKQTDFSSYSDAKLKSSVKKFFNLMPALSVYLAFPVSAQPYFEEEVRNYLSARLPDQKLVEDYFRKLTAPSKTNTGFNEQVHILRLAEKYKRLGTISGTLRKEIDGYLFLYDVLGVKYGIGELWTHTDIVKRIKHLARHNPQQRISHMRRLRRTQQRAAREALAAIKADKEFCEFVRVVREYVFIRTYRTDVLSAAFANAFNLFDEIARRTGSGREDVMECLPDEVLRFDVPSGAFVQKRAKSILIHARHSKIYYEYGKAADRILSKLWENVNAGIKPKPANKDIGVIGSIAHAGIARGITKVVLRNQDLSKVKKGDILVAVMTTPDFVPAMERAAAFVTDEGGVLCHAAIISREMNKPCVIGAKIATKVFKDGDKVEVDAERGVVRKLG